MAKFYTYMLRCADNSLYTGITTDPERRLCEHNAKNEKSAKYTSSHGAEKFECLWRPDSRALASKLEFHLKTLTKTKKEQLILNPDLLSSLLGEKLDADSYTNIKTDD